MMHSYSKGNILLNEDKIGFLCIYLWVCIESERVIGHSQKKNDSVQ